MPAIGSSSRSSRGFVASAIAALGACADEDENHDPEGAAEVWARIHDENYRAWERAPGFETRKPSQASHGDAVDIYVNPIVSDALRSSETITQWPVGSIIVIAMFICPPAAARLMTDRIGPQIAWSVVFAVMSAVIGYVIAGYGPLWLGARSSVSAAGMIATVSGLILFICCLVGPRRRGVKLAANRA